MSTSGNEGCTLTGALSVTTEVANSITLIHGPAGCAHHNVSLLHAVHLARDRISMPRVRSTDLKEEEIIFGGEAALEEAIRAATGMNPDLIFVLSTCVTGTIGDDIGGICGEEWGVPVLSLQNAGFLGGGFYSGTMQALISISGLCTPSEGKGTVNLIGEKSLEYEVEEQYLETKRLLALLGVGVNIRFVRHTNLPELHRMGEASLNILRDPGISTLGKHLQTRLTIPYLDSFPVGMEGTLQFLEKIGEYLDVDSSRAIAAERTYQRKVLSKFPQLKGKKIRLDPSMLAQKDREGAFELLEALDMGLDPDGFRVPVPDPFPVGTSGLLRLLHRWRRFAHA
ncbi:MAG: nitrogenase component 1 [Methanolinea sp.]|nr:nitrogenase component 1 [Methanolinea sp.]